MLNEYLETCAVVGAGGKMGRGIALLLLQEMARTEAEKTGKISGRGRLYLVDMNDDILTGLQSYLKNQMLRYSEKNIVALRSCYQDRPDLLENHEIVAEFIGTALSMVRLVTDIKEIGQAKLIFEAIVEKPDVKARVFSQIKEICGDDSYILTNTSSIPISVLDEMARLEGRLIGYHFYNPPAVQKLLEIITSPKTDKKLHDLATELSKRLQKIQVPAHDVAGFIGNGHFMRDGLFGMELARELEKELAPHEAIYLANKVSEEFMIRPMGIFQLMDYVGLDVCRMIMKTMDTYIESETIHSDLIDRMYDAGVKGGQFADGSQKDGFLKYQKGRPVGVFSLKKNNYVMFDDAGWTKTCNLKLGVPPAGHLPWKALNQDQNKDQKLKAYFDALFQADTLGARLAQRYLIKSKEIARKLVTDGVAHNVEDVNAVLMNGFYHLYGPDNEYY